MCAVSSFVPLFFSLFVAFIIKINPIMPTKDSEATTSAEGWGLIVKIIISEAFMVPI